MLQDSQGQNLQNIPSPTSYAQWYSTLPEEQLPYCYTPQHYSQWYYYQSSLQAQYAQYGYSTNYQSVPVQNNQNKKQKLSRNQKRKLKKKELEQEYEKQRKELGKWVDLERKDLVEGIKKIEEKEQKIKQKKKEKLSHLIQIHKQVYKHILKKNKGRINREDHAGNFRRKKKKPSHIKKMKQLYEQAKKNKNSQPEHREIVQQKLSKGQEIKDDDILRQQDYVTQSQSETEQKNTKLQCKKLNSKKQMLEQKNKDSQQARQVKKIEYKTVGKLTGYLYHEISLREWVDHVPSAKLEDMTLRLVNRLAYKQAIKKITHPEKARKLIIAGLHECKRTLWTTIDKKKSKLLIIALNIERNDLERGTDDQMQQVLSYAYEANVPVVHISTRAKIGRAFTGKFGPRISMLSVINYEGYQDMMELIMEEWKEMKNIYDTTNKYMFKF